MSQLSEGYRARIARDQKKLDRIEADIHNKEARGESIGLFTKFRAVLIDHRMEKDERRARELERAERQAQEGQPQVDERQENLTKALRESGTTRAHFSGLTESA